MHTSYNYAHNWDTSSFPEEQINERNERKVKKRYKNVNGKRKFVIKTGLLLFAYAMILVYFCIQSATLGYQIVDLDNSIQNLENSNKRLEYQIAQKTSLQKVEKIAGKELGMYKPDTTSELEVAYQAQPTQAKNGQKTVTQAKSAEKSLDKLYNALLHLAQKDI